MKKVILLILGWGGALYGLYPLICENIRYHDLDAAGALLLVLYGIIIFISALVKIDKFPLIPYFIGYIFVSLNYFYMVIFFSRDQGILLLMYIISSAILLFIVGYHNNLKKMVVKNIDK